MAKSLQEWSKKLFGKKQDRRIEQPVTPMDIEFSNITQVISAGYRKEKKVILKGVSGHFKAGQLTGIMGPSGAGKSSLLNALTGFSSKGLHGTICAGSNVFKLGDKSTYQAMKVYRDNSRYIQQDDRLNPLFTVNELMTFAADLKLGTSMDTEKKRELIDSVLETLSLSRTKETRCGLLSGGQKKRLSVAVELLDNPTIIFLDEPTTGLDSMSSTQCMELLKNLANDGRTIVCTIHQPSATIYGLFDQIFMMAEGRNIYDGTPQNTVPFLSSIGLQCPVYHNPADYILEVATGEYGHFNDVLEDQSKNTNWNKTPSGAGALKSYVGHTTRGKNNNEMYKLGVLLRRCCIQLYRDWTVTHLKVVLHCMVGILLGLLFQGCGSNATKILSNMGFLLVTVVYLTYTSIMPACLRFPQELLVLRKEYFNSWYSLRTYYTAVLITSAPLQVLFSVVYTVPSYMISGQPLEIYRFLLFAVITAHVALLADGFGNIIGSCLNPVNGTFIGAIFTCILIVFSGYLVLLLHMASYMRAISHVLFSRFGFEGLVISIYGYDRAQLDCPSELHYCHYRQPKTMFTLFGLDEKNYITDVAVLLAQLVIVRLIAYWTLKRQIRIAT